MKNKWKAWILIFSLILTCGFPGSTAQAKDYERPENGYVTVDGQTKPVRFVNYEYDHNRFISIRDLAAALIGTPKQFEVSVSSELIKIDTGMAYVGNGAENQAWSHEEEQTWHTYVQKLNPMKIDDRSVKYFTFLFQMNGYYDCFISTLDAAMLLDLQMECIGDNNWIIDTTQDYRLDMADLDEEEFFQSIHGAYIGDATAGEAYFTYDADGEFAMASTTKLMTCLLTYEAIANGEIGMEDSIAFSENVDELAHGTDAVLQLYRGKSGTVKDMLAGCLLPSSNEAALALAEHIDGSEEVFLERMNRKARELGMYHTYFYNCHGLPYFSEELIPVKAQNHTSAADMYALASYIVNNYPDMLSITGSTKISLNSIGATVQSTNYCLYNVPEMMGLKTGTTNRAGYCLITASRVALEDGDHMVVTVLLGAESNFDRSRLSEMMARYAIDRAKNPEQYKHLEIAIPVTQEPPKKAKDLLQYCITNLKKEYIFGGTNGLSESNR